MCLGKVFTKKERERVLAGLSDEFTVWKVIIDDEDELYDYEYRYITDCRCLPIHAGEMKFETNIIYGSGSTYRGGGHFWLHKKAADEWATDIDERVIRCRVKKKWITNMGTQEEEEKIVIVAKKAVFPKYIGQMDVKDN